ncbi:hypothetical protein ABT364_22580 [Massilia sp. SR12]
MMAASKLRKAHRAATLPKLRIHDPGATQIPQRLGGGIVKEYAEIELATGKLWRYSLVYINPAINSRDNGRVLGYDNAHGYPHRHLMGSITPEPAMSWPEVRDRFRREWRQIAKQFLEGEW